MQEETIYNLTFTAGALLMNETCAVAEVYLETGRNWEITKERSFKENLMGKEKVSTNQRFFSLVKQRIEALNEDEQDLLVSGSNSIKRLILLLAICKAHTLIFDFLFFNVRESFFNMNEKVTHANSDFAKSPPPHIPWASARSSFPRTMSATLRRLTTPSAER